MKAFLRENQSFIAVYPLPKKDTKDGITIFLDDLSEKSTDIIKGRTRYDLPPHMRGHVISVLIHEL